MADGRVTIDTRIDPDGAVTGIRSLEKPLKSMAGKLAGIFAAAFAVDKLFNFGKAAVNLASDLDEVQNVVDVSFGEMTYKMEQFADTAIETFGISRLAAKQTGSTFMAMAKSLGLSSDKASDMAISLTGLSADMASFYNLSQEETFSKLRSIFTGETEALKSLGIVMTQTNLEAFALSKGMTKSIKKMSQAELVQLRYAYVMEQTALAQGDFARTSDGFANQTRILSEQWKEFQLVVGEVLKTAIIPLIKYLNQAMKSLIKFATMAKTALMQLFGIQTNNEASAKSNQVLDTTSNAIDDVTDSTEELTEAEKEQEKQLKKSLRGWDELNNITSDIADTDTDLADELDMSNIDTSMPTDELADGTANTQLDEFKNKLEELKQYLTPYWEQIKNQWQQSWDGIKSVWQPVLEGIWEDIKSLAEPLKTAFKDYVIPAFASITSDIIFVFGKLVEDVGMILGGIWKNLVFPSADSFVKNAIPVFSEVAKQISNTFKIAFEEVNKLFVKFWEGTINPLLALMGKIISNIFEDMKAVWDEKGKPVFDSINEAIQAVGEYLNSLYDNILKPVFDYIIEQANEIWDEHLREAFKDIGLAIMEIVEFLGHFITGIASAKTEFTQTFGSDIVAVINSFVTIMSDAVKTVIDKLDGFIQMVQGLFMILNGLFTNDTEKMLAGADKVWDGFFKGIEAMGKYMVNSLINLLNLLIAKINMFAGLAGSAINAVLTSMGGSSISIPKIPSIPKLATGAVIPANKPFMAMLGDQKQGTNIEAPLDTIKQALSEVMQGYSGGNNGDIVVQIDGREVFRAVRSQSEDFRRMTGKGAFA